MAERDPRVVGITPAMREGSGLVEFSKSFPERYFDVAIAEQHAVTLAAGMACEGARPVVAIYSTFLQRAYDQLIHDVALQNLPVVLRDRPRRPGGRRRRHAPGRLRPLLPALHPEHGGDGAGRRERMPADAVHRRHARRPGGRALSARPRPGRGRSSRDDRAAGGPGRSAARGPQRPAAARLRHDGRTVRRHRGATRRHPGQHALRQAARRGTGVPARGQPPLRHHARGKRRRRRCGQRRQRVPRRRTALQRAVHHIGIPDRFIEHGSREDCLAMAGLDAAGIDAPGRADSGRPNPPSARPPAAARARHDHGLSREDPSTTMETCRAGPIPARSRSTRSASRTSTTRCG